MRDSASARTLRTFAALCAVLGLFPLANALTDGAAVPWWRFAAGEWIWRGAFVVLLAFLIAAVMGTGADALFDTARQRILSISSRAFGFGAALAAVVFAALVSRYCFSGQPFTTDEMVQQWHARILLSGHLSAIAEPNREFFNTAQVFDRDGRWFSQYPIGAPALIAAGMLLRAAWLVNPILLGVATWHLYRFLGTVADELTARVTTLLFLTSPMVLVMGASQMSHVPALAFTMIALASLARWDQAETAGALRVRALVTGFGVGLVTLVRPLDGAVLGVIIGGFQLWRARGDARRWTSLALEIAGAALPIAVLLWANARTTGHPFLFGYEALNGEAHAIGFHVDPNGEMHTPVRGLVRASGYLMRLSRYLFEWPIPGVLVIVAGLVAIRRPTRWDVLLAALCFVLLAAYGAYWFDGFFAGPRFLFTVVPAFVYFAARAPGEIAAVTRWPILRRVALLIVPLCIIATWIGPVGVSSARGTLALYRSQRTKLKTNIEAQVDRAQLHNALVLVNEGWRGRLLARLRVLGLTSFRAERVLNTLDACGLQTGLDAEDTLMSRSPEERIDRVLKVAGAVGKAELQPGLQADQTIALVAGSQPTPTCLREYEHDVRQGTIAYSPFLSRQRVGSDGRVDGNVVFARDLGDRNERLRSRFGDRTWYAYRPPRSLEDTTPPFEPYTRK